MSLKFTDKELLIRNLETKELQIREGLRMCNLVSHYIESNCPPDSFKILINYEKECYEGLLDTNYKELEEAEKPKPRKKRIPFVLNPKIQEEIVNKYKEINNEKLSSNDNKSKSLWED